MKPGMNSSEVNTCRKWRAAGKTVEEVSQIMQVYTKCIQSFYDLWKKEEGPAKTTAKSTAKGKTDKGAAASEFDAV